MEKKVVYNADELVFPGAWPLKDGGASRGVKMGKIVSEMADTSHAKSMIVGFETHGWDTAKLPPAVYECCAAEAINRIDDEYRFKFNEIFGPLSTLKFESFRDVYCLAATRRALVAVKESLKHNRDTIVVNDNDDTNSTGAVVVDEQSPRKRPKKIEENVEEKKMSDDLP